MRNTSAHVRGAINVEVPLRKRHTEGYWQMKDSYLKTYQAREAQCTCGSVSRLIPQAFKRRC